LHPRYSLSGNSTSDFAAGAANLPLSVFFENLAFFFEKWSGIPALH
jgi:hypothetical protein